MSSLVRCVLLRLGLLAVEEEKTPKHFLDLPYDIILLILDCLALHDQFRLSHTCRAIQNIASRDWEQELQRCTKSERVEFWTGLAYTMPRHWVCAECCKLHIINPVDTPTKARIWPCGIPLNWTMDRYLLLHQHVQLALKFSYLGVNQEHLARMLATCTIRSRATSGPIPTTIFYTVRPKIIRKHFCLFKTWVFTNPRDPVSLDDMGDYALLPCPHLTLPDKEDDFLVRRGIIYGAFKNKATLAMAFPGREMHGSCRSCPTDFSFLVDPTLRQVTCKAWYDFGTYGSPLDRYWTSQVMTDKNDYMSALLFDREPGSSRALYLSSEPLEPVVLAESGGATV
ncbi:hypothetical protein PT974_10339 [Cladobotryum mycophilum]|uniref:F-box domain-containing protein n=1 Tax=Cladobotryum mycophilum TaxID=491253 RepID=A0ABR0S9Q5_9HYPO